MKNSKLIALICLLGIFFTSCDKEPKSEWKAFYNFTNEDIIGTYSYSDVSGAFDDIEGIGRHACDDAQVRIQALYDHSDWIKFIVNCPSEDFSRNFEGEATLNEGDYMIRMSTDYIHSGGKVKAYNLNASVMMNEKQEIRLHGFAAENTYKEINDLETGVTTYETIDGEYYYFDVIKN